MNTSVEKNNPEVLSGNKTGGIHSHKSLISPSNQKKKKQKKHNTAQNKTKQNKNKNLQSQKCVQLSKLNAILWF